MTWEDNSDRGGLLDGKCESWIIHSSITQNKSTIMIELIVGSELMLNGPKEPFV